jgi:hypothetical protein
VSTLDGRLTTTLAVRGTRWSTAISANASPGGSSPLAAARDRRARGELLDTALREQASARRGASGWTSGARASVSLAARSPLPTAASHIRLARQSSGPPSGGL